MKYAVAVFRSKTEVFRFMEYMERVGASCSTVGTPREVKIGCGIAAKIPYNFISRARSVIERGDFSGFYALILYQSDGIRRSSVRIM